MGKRPHISLKNQRDAAILQLGLDPKTAELDHYPAVGMRVINPDGSLTPAFDDPNFLVWRDPVDHAKKTDGTKATTAGSDKHIIAKIVRFEKAAAGVVKPKRKILSRPFPKGRKMQSRGWRRRP